MGEEFKLFISSMASGECNHLAAGLEESLIVGR